MHRGKDGLVIVMLPLLGGVTGFVLPPTRFFPPKQVPCDADSYCHTIAYSTLGNAVHPMGCLWPSQTSRLACLLASCRLFPTPGAPPVECRRCMPLSKSKAENRRRRGQNECTKTNAPKLLILLPERQRNYPPRGYLFVLRCCGFPVLIRRKPKHRVFARRTCIAPSQLASIDYRG